MYCIFAYAREELIILWSFQVISRQEITNGNDIIYVLLSLLLLQLNPKRKKKRTALCFKDPFQLTLLYI